MPRQLEQDEIDGVFERLKGQQDAVIEQKKVAVFSFRRPDRIAKSQMKALHLLHEIFARNLSSSLAVYLRTHLTVTVISVEQFPYIEFLEGLPSPTCMVSMGLKPYEGSAALEIDLSLIFPIIEILLGGKGRALNDQNREISVIERSLLDSIFRIILSDLREAWKGVAAIDFQIAGIENETQTAQIISPAEAVVAISFEIHIGENTGTLNIAIPSLNIKMIGQRFEQQLTSRRTEPTGAGQTRMLTFLRQADVTCDARLVGPSLTVRDLLAMEVGDCLEFDYPTGKKLDLLVNGKAAFRGEVTSSRNHRVFDIDQPVPTTGVPAVTVNRALLPSRI